MLYKVSYIPKTDLTAKIINLADLKIYNTITITNVKIQDVTSVIDASNYTYITFNVDSLDYCKKLSRVDNSIPVQLFTDALVLSSGDVYDISIFYENANTEILFITLQLIKAYTNNYKSIDITNTQYTCPSCKMELVYCLDTGDYRCKNPFCLSKRITGLTRFISLAMKMPELVPVIKMVSLTTNKVTTPVDIFTLDISTLSSCNIPAPMIDNILIAIQNVKGKIKFSDYLYALPNIDYLLGGYNLNRITLYSEFENPITFINWIDKVGDTTKNCEFNTWKERQGEVITHYMSLLFFWKVYEYLYTMTSELITGRDIVTELYNLGVFAPFVRSR